eukprot:12910114-Ditylum_brightwellii.AAC.1
MVYDTAVNFYNGWFDPMPFTNTTKPLKASDILNVVYNDVGEQAYLRVYQNEPDIWYNEDVKDKIMYLDNPKTKKHYQHYKNQ